MALASIFLFLGCENTSSLPDTAAAGPDAGVSDQGFKEDSGQALDSGSSVDAGSMDAGQQQPRGWQDRAALGAGPRQETSVLALDGQIYVLGGFDANAAFGDRMEAYSPQADSWQNKAALPARMHHTNAAVAGGKIYLLGYLKGNFVQDGRSYVYDPQQDSWSPISSLPSDRARGASSVVVSEGLIYIVGGFRQGRAVSLVDVYDPAADSYRPLPPIPRVTDHAVATAYQSKIYLAGGRDTRIGNHTDRLDIYSIANGEWSLGAPMPTSRGGAMGARLGGRFYVIGGEGNPQAAHGLFAQVEAYDFAEDKWYTLDEMMPARHGTGAAALNGAIHVPGGADVEAFGAVATHQVFVP